MLWHKDVKIYEQYVEKQRGKISFKLDTIKDRIPERVQFFKKVFESLKDTIPIEPILCLGVRTGCENKGANLVGFEGSIGIDLHPVGEYVIAMDWHNMSFKNGSFTNIFSNSFDHCCDFKKLITEIKRILKQDGFLIFMVMKKHEMKNYLKDEWLLKVENRDYDFLFWESDQDLIQEFQDIGFHLIKKWEEGNKWNGYVMQKKK